MRNWHRKDERQVHGYLGNKKERLPVELNEQSNERKNVGGSLDRMAVNNKDKAKDLLES